MRVIPGRAAAALTCLWLVGTSLLLVPTTADAHPLSTTAVLLDVGTDEVTGQVQLPIDRLAIALGRPDLTTKVAGRPEETEELRRYVAAHLAATSTNGGAAWGTAVSGGRVETVDDVDHLVYDVALTPPGGTVTDFSLHYDAIVARLVSHRVFVSERPAGTTAYTAVGVIDWESQTLVVPAVGPTTGQGFVPAVRLGVHHIGSGADHLLFLVMLLLPAPLLARGGRWVRTGSTSAADLRRSCWRVVHVVTAFALGHSITLALAASGYVHAPGRLVESMIAASILMSGLHAIRPVARGGEPWIAAGFGLMHGLAFATLLGPLDLTRGSLVTELLGFNLGIELTQLLVVGLLMPSLMVLSRTRVYSGVRVVLAGGGVVLALGWLAERTTVITTDPLEPLTDAMVAHPVVVAATLATAAALARAADRRPAGRSSSDLLDSIPTERAQTCSLETTS